MTTRGEGHGHGLPQTRELLEIFGGAVELIGESSSVGGAHFQVRVPVVQMVRS